MPDSYSVYHGGSIHLFKKGFSPTDRRGAGSYLPGAASPRSGTVYCLFNSDIAAFFPNVSLCFSSDVKHEYCPPLLVKMGSEQN